MNTITMIHPGVICHDRLLLAAHKFHHPPMLPGFFAFHTVPSRGRDMFEFVKHGGGRRSRPATMNKYEKTMLPRCGFAGCRLAFAPASG